MSLYTAISIILVFIALLASYRLFVGPSVYDRLISLNVVGVLITIILILISVETDLGLYLDIALSFVMLDFVGTIALVKYLEGGEFV
ncbi:MAG: pH regulation protein F [Candidatus Thermoplasmatota archaeon]|nr:pH regulation protein F [Candidatus Thermoplasmatota archaeon]MBS3790616.1 pH regulation protein F [Candidatus Thermoplasmatota archaeon]